MKKRGSGNIRSSDIRKKNCETKYRRRLWNKILKREADSYRHHRTTEGPANDGASIFIRTKFPLDSRQPFLTFIYFGGSGGEWKKMRIKSRTGTIFRCNSNNFHRASSVRLWCVSVQVLECSCAGCTWNLIWTPAESELRASDFFLRVSYVDWNNTESEKNPNNKREIFFLLFSEKCQSSGFFPSSLLVQVMWQCWSR